MFNTNSAYSINEIVFGKEIPRSDSDYGVFVLRGEPEFSHDRVLILAIMKTDGKTFWPIATNVKNERAFASDPLLSTREGNVSAVLQRNNDGNRRPLVVRRFSWARSQ